jgi:methylenetetrahydrofolate reductase (NADPH)
MNRESIQLEMNFDGTNENRFKQRFDLGEFQLIAELPVPSADTPLADAVRRAADFEYLIHSQEHPKASIAFINEAPAGYALDMVQFASELCKYSRDRHVLYLHGRDHTVGSILESVRHAHSEGFKNFCAVTGAAVHGETADQTRKHVFLESVNMLGAIRDTGLPSISVGAVVNPYQYTPESAYAQSFKMFRKLANGADYLVAQYGWDMMKLQEMIWNLFRREINIPTVARLLFLTPDNAEQVCAGAYHGIHISPDFEVLLKKERSHSFAQFEAAQLRRIQIHAAGARLLGFSAVQIAGITNVALLETVLQKIREAFREFQTFQDWRTAYGEYYDRLDMAPYPNEFYLFNKLLESDLPTEQLALAAGIRPLTRSERFRLNLAGSLLSNADKLPARERRLTKKILVSCRGCDQCRLPLTDYVCPETCPKGLANGSCGCCKANGECELTGEECIFAKRLRIADSRIDYSSLEEGAVPPVEERP